MLALRFVVPAVMLAAYATAAAVEKRLAPAPAPTIPPGLVPTDSGCFDAGDCFIYQYPDFAAQCIQGKCYKPATQSNPFGLPTLPAVGAPAAARATPA